MYYGLRLNTVSAFKNHLLAWLTICTPLRIDTRLPMRAVSWITYRVGDLNVAQGRVWVMEKLEQTAWGQHGGKIFRAVEIVLICRTCARVTHV